MQSLSFKRILVERKIEVIYKVKGEKIQPIAKEAGVDRSSLEGKSFICFKGSS